MKGKKTYIVAGVMIAATALKVVGVIDSTAYEALMGILAALGFGALRVGVESVAKECESGK